MEAGERGREESSWREETRLSFPPWSRPATTYTRLAGEEGEEGEVCSSAQERRQACWETLSLSSLLSSLEESQAARHPPVQSRGKSQREVEDGSSSTSRHSARQSSISSLGSPAHRAWQVAVSKCGFSRLSSRGVELELELEEVEAVVVEAEEVGVMRTVRRKTVEMVIIMFSGRLLESD